MTEYSLINDKFVKNSVEIAKTDNKLLELTCLI